MANPPRDSGAHVVKIQQVYWARDAAEDGMVQHGATCVAKVEEQVEYHDTDTYDLASHGAWLSKIGGDWRLIVEQSGQQKTPFTDQTNRNRPLSGNWEINGKSGKKVDLMERKQPRRDLETQRSQGTSKTDGSNVSAGGDIKARNSLTCYELLDEREIVEYLSRVLGHDGEFNVTTVRDFLETAGIRHYEGFLDTRQVTYKLGDLYTIVLTTDPATSRKVATVSLEVEIEKVTEGFQRLERLASDLNLQLKNK
ncbi:uncharacterized protein LOC128502630 [Spea bombifrons]|uniref:uncharacterized protein LOC128502630 n=1 Tax=Spea bombifrons TaxID=233779 RepID=UPI0023493304|nr:uncharacterized protein LOC128502630 [Spea bombifrons]